MKNRILVLTLIALLVLSSLPVMAGNGAPNGAHFNLNIIGVDNPKNEDMDQAAGHVIFVNLDGKSKINLVDADGPDGDGSGDFKVLDKNGTDKDGAIFQLPKPGFDPYIVEDNTEPVMSDYTVFVRPLGKPGGWTTITTCAELVDSDLSTLLGSKTFKEIKNLEGNTVVSIEQVGSPITFRNKGKTSFTDVTAELTSIVLEVEIILADSSTDLIYIRVPLFHESMEGYYWDYDNAGLKLLQVRFYEGGVDVSEKDLLLPAH